MTRKRSGGRLEHRNRSSLLVLEFCRIAWAGESERVDTALRCTKVWCPVDIWRFKTYLESMFGVVVAPPPVFTTFGKP